MNNDMTLYQTVHQVARSYGVDALAKAMNKKRGTLYNKLNPTPESRHALSLSDAIQITRISGDTSIIVGLARMFGLATFNVANVQATSDMDLLDVLCGMQSESGQFHAAIREGLADLLLTRREWEHIRAEALDVVGAVMAIVARLEPLIDD